MLAAPLLSLALSCALEPGDRDHYLASTRVPAVEARAACQRIARPDLRADCLLQVAARAAREGDDAGADATCEAMRPSFWQEECWFLVNDTLSATSSAAMARCKQAGRFMDHCVQHASHRGLAAEVQRQGLGVGDEERIRAVALEMLPRYRYRRAEAAPSGARVDVAVAAVIAARLDPAAPFDAASCGTARPDVCGLAWTQSLREAHGAGALEALCAIGPPDLAGVPGPGWTEASEGTVRAALVAECLRAGGR